MNVRVRFSGYVDVEVPDGLSGEALDDAIGEAWARVPSPEDTDYDDAVKVGENDTEHALDCDDDDCDGCC